MAELGCCTHHIYVWCADWQIDPSRVPEAELHFILLLCEDLGWAVCLMCWRMVSLGALSSRDINSEDSRE